MSKWRRGLTAGVTDPGTRRDYDEQRRLVAGFRPTSYLAVRLLLPRSLLPHVVATKVVMHRSLSMRVEGPDRAMSVLLHQGYAQVEMRPVEADGRTARERPQIRLGS